MSSSLTLIQALWMLVLVEAAQAGVVYKGPGSGMNLATFGGNLPDAVKVIRVTNTVAIPVPVPYPITKHVPYPVSVPKPIPYAVPQPVPVEVTRPVVIQQAIPVGIPKPYPVPQPLGVPSPSEQLTAPQYTVSQQDYSAYVSYGPSSYGQEQDYGYHPSAMGGYAPTAQEYMTDNTAYGVMLGQSFENTNRLEEHPHY